MKILNYSALILFSSLFLMLVGCSNKKPPVKASYPQMINTKWHYMDSDWEYDMEFLPGGILRTQHPNDQTPNNDKWRQSGHKIYFYFNDQYSVYEGNFSGNNIISGTAESKTGAVWNWKAIRSNTGTTSRSKM